MSSGPVVGVLSGCGGAGASVLAAVIAGCAAEGDSRHGGSASSGAARSTGPVFLIDCDRLGGGIDVLLGAEQVPGPRWRQVRLRGGRLDAATLVETLPSWGRVRFLAADDATELDAGGVSTVVGAAALAGTVVLDLPRWPSAVRAAALALCERVILVTPAEVRAVTASALISAGLDAERAVVAVRGVSRLLPAARIGELLGLPVLGSIPWDPAAQAPAGLELSRLKRPLKALARAALELTAPPAPLAVSPVLGRAGAAA